MADNRQTGPMPTESRPQLFTPVPYRADGSVSFGGGMQLIGVLGFLGIVLGVIASFVSRFFYLIILFPIIIGGCLGLVGSSLIKKFHVRNPVLCGIAGFVAGCLAMLTMHYTDFRYFEQNMQAALTEEGHLVQQIALRIDDIKTHWDDATEEERLIVTDLETDPATLRALRVNSVWRYIDMMAHEGVELNPGGGGAGRGINLGYVGSYIYWGIEALIVAGIAFSMMTGAANEPYCAQCGNWKQITAYGPLADSTEVARHIREGSLVPFSADPADGTLDAVVTLFTCPECETEGEVDVLVERWTVNKKGETSKKKLTKMTYPAEALPVLQTVCTPPVVELPEESADSETEADPAAEA